MLPKNYEENQLCVTGSFFTRNPNTVCHIMTLLVYKFVRQVKLIVFIVLMKMVEYRNLYLDYYFLVV